MGFSSGFSIVFRLLDVFFPFQIAWLGGQGSTSQADLGTFELADYVNTDSIPTREGDQDLPVGGFDASFDLPVRDDEARLVVP